MKKLAIVVTHPIQYYTPVFKLLSERNRIEIKVFYTLGIDYYSSKYDPGFGKTVSWDIPLLDGYGYEWANNISDQPGTRSFKGIKTPYLVEQVENFQPNAILVYGWAYQSHLKVLRYFHAKIPVYFKGDSTLLNEGKGLRKTIKYLFLRRVYKNVDHAFYVGKNNKAYFMKYGLKEKQLSFAPHAIDNERFSVNRAEDAIELRSSLNIPEEAILILYAGKFESVKNLELLLSAFIKLNNPNAHLLLVGNGVLEDKLKNIAESNTVKGNIHFMDFKNQTFMPALYQAADLFCMPSKSESWGLGINEAMACSRAILASDKVGCAVDLVREGKNGAIFKSEDENNIVGHLRQLTVDKAELTQFGRQSWLIIRDWNFTRVAEAIENKLMA